MDIFQQPDGGHDDSQKGLGLFEPGPFVLKSHAGCGKMKMEWEHPKASGKGEPGIGGQSWRLPEALDRRVKAFLEDWGADQKTERLWSGDASLWTGSDEGGWLGWLRIVDDQLADLGPLRAISEEVKVAGFSHVLLLGMGGSSLCPEVMAATFGRIEGFPEFSVLDSTDPAQIETFEKRVDLSKTVFVVSSKSGTTLEPGILMEYFFDRVREITGEDGPGSRFIAVTDPGSRLEEVAERRHFRRIFYGHPNIGGRYSALSNFGMVPAALMGVDVARFLGRASEMVRACADPVPPGENPGLVLGAILGAAGECGLDKVTLVASPGLSGLGAWLEQLIAESTGKSGRGLIPVDHERLGPPEVYGDDRLFVYIRLNPSADRLQDEAVDALERKGHPVVRIPVEEAYDLGQEFFRWEFAVAVAGSILGIHPFNQPDVEASKAEAQRLTVDCERTGRATPAAALFEQGGLKLVADETNAETLKKAAGGDPSLQDCLKAHLDRLGPGDYFALLAHLERNGDHEAALQAIRHAVRDGKRVATCLGFGPRFLHSTGQAFKGGPNSGVFLQVTCDDSCDLPVPGKGYSFGAVKAAQALADFQVMTGRGRRALRVHLGQEVRAGLKRLEEAVKKALS